jgi:hypothetical protein
VQRVLAAPEAGGGGHFVLMCRVERASARASHWAGGKALAGEPPTLSFLGSSRFAAIAPLDAEEPADVRLQ